MIKLGIIEDDGMVRRSLVSYFEDEPGFECLLSAASVESFMALWENDNYLDLLLLDVSLPGMSGIEGLKIIREKEPKIQVMMFTIFEDTQTIFQALCAGASGYVSKQTPLVKIKEALQTIYDGGSYMSPGIARKITDYFNPTYLSPNHNRLTPREGQVLHAIEQGLSNKRIAEQLSISIETVKSHVKKIYVKLEVNNRMDIVRGKYR